MKRLIPFLFASALLVCSCADEKTPGEYVDPNIGGVSDLLTIVQPQVQRPHSMVRVAPVYAGSLNDTYLADEIIGIMINMPRYRLGYTSMVMATSGPVAKSRADRATWADKGTEELHPWKHHVTFADFDIEAEWATTERGLILTFDYAEGPANVYFSTNNRSHLNIEDGDKVYGWEYIQNNKQYFYAELDHEFPETSETELDGRGLDAWLSDPDFTGTLTVRVGVSLISVRQAKENLEKELSGKSIADVEKKSRDLWEDALGKIKVEGGTEREKTIFYTCLYRTKERMIDYNEYGFYFSNFDGTVHEAVEPFYCDDWMWDTYRCKHALGMILDPLREEQMLNSYAQMYFQYGWVPQFPEVDSWGHINAGGHEFEVEPMIGNHVASFAAEAIKNGLIDWDIEFLYEGLRKNVFEGTLVPWRSGAACELDDFYNKNGYMPALNLDEPEPYAYVDNIWERRQAVSVTLEHSYDDYCLAQIAKWLQKDDDYEALMERSYNYLKLWNPETEYFAPKDENGNWIDPFDIEYCGGDGARRYFTECGGRVYVFSVQHDIQKLIDLCGGNEGFIKKLDDAYNESPMMGKWRYLSGTPDGTGLQGMIPTGNEQAFHVPYLYNYAGAAWKTQNRVRQTADTFFNDKAFGLVGDEDGGALCAWYVFASLGFYPVNPVSGEYAISSPFYEKITMEVGTGKTFTILAPGASIRNKYIKEVKLNGKPLGRPFINHSDIMKGGTLEFELVSDKREAKQF